jgi:hypothetical protein
MESINVQDMLRMTIKSILEAFPNDTTKTRFVNLNTQDEKYTEQLENISLSLRDDIKKKSRHFFEDIHDNIAYIKVVGTDKQLDKIKKFQKLLYRASRNAEDINGSIVYLKNLEYVNKRLEEMTNEMKMSDNEDTFTTPYTTESDLPNEQIDINIQTGNQVFALRVQIYNNNGEKTGKTHVHRGLNKNNYNLLKYAFNECKELSRYTISSEEKVDGKTGASILTCYCQGGKTLSALYHILLAIIYKKNVLVVTMNQLDQKTQFKNSMRNDDDTNSFYHKLKTAGVDHDFTPPDLVFREVNDEDVAAADMRAGGAIFCCIHNTTQLGKFKKLIDNNQDLRNTYIVILDESDLGLKQNHNKHSARDKITETIIGNASWVIYVTATHIGHVIIDGEYIKVKDIVKIQTSPNYVGNGHRLLEVHNISDHATDEEGEKYSIIRKYTDSRFKPQHWFVYAVEHHLSLSRTSTRMSNESFNMLIKVTDSVENQRLIQQYLIDNYSECPSLVINGSSLKFYLPTNGTTCTIYQFKINKWLPKSAKYTTYQLGEGGTIHEWHNTKYASYAKLKKYIKELLSQLFIDTLMFEIAGRKADRGIRYKDEDHKWMISGELYIDSDNVDYATACHAAGRINGNREHNDMDRKYLYTSGPIINTLRNGNEVYEKYVDDHDIKINELKEANHEDRDIMISDMVNEIPLTSDQSSVKFTKACTLLYQRKKGFKTFIEKSGDIENNKKHCLVELENNVRNAIDTDRDTVIIRILRYMKNCPEVTQTKLHEMCNAAHIGHYTKWNKTHGQYKILVLTTANLYELNPEILYISDLVH